MDNLLSINFVWGNLENIVIFSFLRGTPTLHEKLVTISLNFTDSCLLMALSID